MSTRAIESRHALGGEHATIKIRVGFDKVSDRTFHESVTELADSIGVFPQTTLPIGGQRHLDLRIIGVDVDNPKGPNSTRGVVEFAIPTEVLPDEGAVPLMLAIATYGSVYRFVREYQVLDMDFPSEAMSQHDLCGPRYGADLIPPTSGRARLGLILKPRFATSATQVRKLVRDVAEAGIDYIIDDELTVTNASLTFEARVTAVLDELSDVEVATGRRVPFIANVTGGYRGALHRASIAEGLGAQGVMVNTIAMGYDVVCDLASGGSALGVVANSIGRGVTTSGPEYRIAPELLCKLARLAGADGVYTGPLVGTIDTMKQDAERYRSALQQPYHRTCVRKQSAAVMSGG